MKKNVRGYYMVPAADFIKDRFGSEVRTKVVSRLGEAGQLLESASAEAWYPVEHLEAIVDAVCELVDESARKQMLIDLGRHVAGYASTTFMRLFMRVATPKMVSKQMGPLWKRYHDFGELRIESIEATRITYRIDGAWKHIPAIGAGWIYAMMEGVRKKNVKVDIEPQTGILDDSGSTDVTWVASWD